MADFFQGLIDFLTELFAALEELSDGTYYSAYFSLKTLTEYEDFYKWYSSKNLPCSELWCGVYTSNISTDHLGFCPELSGKCIDWDRETYPRLCILDDHTSVSQMESQQASVEVMQTHFESMLRYMRDSKKTTDDLSFTVETVACLGACGLAPAMTVNDKVYPSMTPEKAVELLKELKEAL